MDRSDGGPAFPIQSEAGVHAHEFGMSLRDYFAARVIPNCCDHNKDVVEASKQAYLIADAMLAARRDDFGHLLPQLVAALDAGLRFIQRHHDDYEGDAPDRMRAALELAERIGLKVL